MVLTLFIFKIITLDLLPAYIAELLNALGVVSLTSIFYPLVFQDFATGMANQTDFLFITMGVIKIATVFSETAAHQLVAFCTNKAFFMIKITIDFQVFRLNGFATLFTFHV
jgi:hypothetical protein